MRTARNLLCPEGALYKKKKELISHFDIPYNTVVNNRFG